LKDFPSVEKVFYRISKLMLLKFSFLFGQMGFLTSTHWKYLFFLFLFLPLSLFSQQRKELLEQQKRLRNDIRLTSNLLKETQKNREATLERFLALQRQIKARKQLINSIQREIQILTSNIERSSEVVESLTSDVMRLKEEYGALLRSAYRQKLNQSDLLFLFSAGSFNEAYRRWQYLKQYDAYRQKQARLILDTQNMLHSKITTLDSTKVKLLQKLDNVKRQAYLMESEISQKDELLQSLENDEARLAANLEAKEQENSRLSDAIERIIRTEMAQRRKSERNNTNFPNVDRDAVPVENLGNAFYKNKGKLPWPVKNGVVTGKFGRQTHPTIKSIEISNNGIDIQTDKNADVRAVFGGEVAGVQFIPGFDYMVIVKHGNYYTVYSNLKEVFVKNGENVKIRTSIGKVSTDSKTNASEVHFEIWKEKNRLNPSDWIARR
jgi:septal ring factor EnvC (AmiA/AmiB activator)